MPVLGPGWNGRNLLGKGLQGPLVSGAGGAAGFGEAEPSQAKPSHQGNAFPLGVPRHVPLFREWTLFVPQKGLHSIRYDTVRSAARSFGDGFEGQRVRLETDELEEKGDERGGEKGE